MLDKLRSEIRNEPIILAHHPLCGMYDDHFIVIHNRKVCRGCLTVYPAALAGLSLLVLLGVDDFAVLSLLSLFLFLLNLPRLLLDRTVGTNLIFNVVLGACLSATILAVVNCPESLFPYYLPLVISTYLLFMGYRGYMMMRRCRSCPHQRFYPACITHHLGIGSGHGNQLVIWK